MKYLIDMKNTGNKDRYKLEVTVPAMHMFVLLLRIVTEHLQRALLLICRHNNKQVSKFYLHGVYILIERRRNKKALTFFLKLILLEYMAQMVTNLTAVKETWVQSLGLENPLEKGMTTHSSILAWRISWTEAPGRLQFHGVTKELDVIL